MLAPQPSYHRCWTAVKTRIHTFARSLSEGARGCTLLEYSVRLKHRDSPRMLRPPGPTRIDPEAASKHQELQDSTINQPPLLQHCSGASKRRPSKARLPSTKRNAVSPPSSGALPRHCIPDPPDLLQFDTTQKRAVGREFKANLRKFPANLRSRHRGRFACSAIQLPLNVRQRRRARLLTAEEEDLRAQLAGGGCRGRSRGLARATATTSHAER